MTIEFVERIVTEYQNLSPNARKVADYLQHNPMDVLSLSVSEIASLTHTSKATVSRFFRQLGYESQLDVKKQLRELRNTGYPLMAEQSGTANIGEELARIHQTLEAITQDELDNMVNAILAARSITIIGYRNSYPVALHFSQQLLQIRDKIRVLPTPGQTLSESLLETDKEDLIILVAFRRRPKIVGHLVEAMKDYNLVMLTDPSGQIYQDKVRQLLVCQLGQQRPLDSYAAPMSIISIICNQTLQAKASFANHRISEISSLFKKLEELE